MNKKQREAFGVFCGNQLDETLNGKLTEGDLFYDILNENKRTPEK